MNRYKKIDLVYDFLLNSELNDEEFTISSLSSYSGLSESTCITYLSKKWYQYIYKNNGEYIAHNIKLISKEQFRHISSQKNKINISELEYGKLLLKAREFAMLAVSIYNNPYTMFKSYGFIINMIIAYTALFHSIFEKKGISYYYKKKDGSFKMIDGQEKAWELSTCMKEYWKGNKQAEAMNLNFLIKLRNRIEHRGLPAIDIMIAGECQAALNNFEVLLSNEFGDEYTLKTNLAISMQLSNVSLQAQINAMKEFQTKSYKAIKEFIDGYKRNLDINILSSQNYRMSVFLIPKIGNHFKSSDLAIEFINVDSLSDEELEKYEQAIGFIKGVELPYKLKPSQVVDKVREEFPNFNMHAHTKLWKEYEARPQHHLRNFRGKFSAYVEGYDSYLYSPKWVEFILQILRK